MTCFWDGIIQSLTLEDFRIVSDFKNKPNPRQLVEFLKSLSGDYNYDRVKSDKL